MYLISLKQRQIDIVRKLEARQRIYGEIQKMREEGKALTLSDEELQLLKSFRRFKLRMIKTSEIFNWQTTSSTGIEIVQDTAEIIHPNELNG